MDNQTFKLGDEFLASSLLKDVISPVTLAYDVELDSDQYILSDSDLQAIKSCVSAWEKPVCRKTSATSGSTQTSRTRPAALQKAADDGRHIDVITSRSGIQRRQVSFLFD